MLQSLQSPDHCLYPGAHLFILVEERGALVCKGFVPLAEGSVLLLQLPHRSREFLDSLVEAPELEIELRPFWIVHFNHYRAALFARSMICLEHIVTTRAMACVGPRG